MSEPALTRRDELLADGALGWLDGGDDAALAAVLREPTAQAELASLERTAAVAARAFAEPPDEQQQRLVRLTAKLHADALARFGPPDPLGGALRAVGPTPPHRRAAASALPWLLAAATAAIALWLRAPAQPLPAPLARDALLRAPHAIVTCAWEPGPSSHRGDVRGDVVWDGSRQEGYLRLQGLPALDAGHRYQLWIVDASREGPPVDGGLLPPLAGDGEAVVRIDARLPVQRAAAFVLTRERAEGAVVSSQQHVVAVAKP